MASAEKTWYNHGTVTIPRPSLGGRGCWQHPRGHAGVWAGLTAGWILWGL